MSKSHRLNTFMGAVLSALLGVVLSAFLGLGNAQAQFGVTFVSFEGAGSIVDNPPSSTCQTAGYSFGDTLLVTYRFSLNPSTPDSIAFIRQTRISRLTSTQSPNFSLNGPSTADWQEINSRPSFVTLTGSSSNLTIQSGLNQPVSTATGNIKMLGTINDFEENAGCTVTFHAALVARPN
jgi:hypothetical protein